MAIEEVASAVVLLPGQPLNASLEPTHSRAHVRLRPVELVIVTRK